MEDHSAAPLTEANLQLIHQYLLICCTSDKSTDVEQATNPFVARWIWLMICLKFFWGSKPLWAGDLFWHTARYRSYSCPHFTALQIWIMQGYTVRDRNELFILCHQQQTTMPKHHFVNTLGKSFLPISVPLPQNKDHYHILMVKKEGEQHTPLSLSTHRKHFS